MCDLMIVIFIAAANVVTVAHATAEQLLIPVKYGVTLTDQAYSFRSCCLW